MGKKGRKKANARKKKNAEKQVTQNNDVSEINGLFENTVATQEQQVGTVKETLGETPEATPEESPEETTSNIQSDGNKQRIDESIQETSNVIEEEIAKLEAELNGFMVPDPDDNDLQDDDSGKLLLFVESEDMDDVFDPDEPENTEELRDFLAMIDESELPSFQKLRNDLEEKTKEKETDLSFGDAFYENQKYNSLSDKERSKEARESLHGFRETMIHEGKEDGVVDESHLKKIFAFEANGDGICRVNYKENKYETGVFVVHRTKGMVLLKCTPTLKSLKKSRIPGGFVGEKEFLAASKLVSQAKMQLQLAARQGAARLLYEDTGIDVRDRMNRLQPAVLRLKPPKDASGVRCLKNEYEQKLYYFLQVSEADFLMETNEDTNSKIRGPESEKGTELRLRLSSRVSAFDFVKDPKKAMKKLDKGGDKTSKTALNLIIDQAMPKGAMSKKAGSSTKPKRKTNSSKSSGTTLKGILKSRKKTITKVTKEIKPSSNIEERKATVDTVVQENSEPGCSIM